MVAIVTTSPLQAEAAKDEADLAYQTITEVAWKEVTVTLPYMVAAT